MLLTYFYVRVGTSITCGKHLKVTQLFSTRMLFSEKRFENKMRRPFKNP
jgi:hypothetical protein